ncbi:MAG: signal peptidase II [Brachymonas sp.]
MPPKKSPSRRSASVKSAGRAHARGLYFWVWMGLAAIIAVADQYTKTLVLGYYQLGDVTPVTSFFNVTRLHNPGAAFSFLADAGGWQRWFFLVVSVVAVCAIVYFLAKHGQQKLFAFALACIMGGALGNLIDRSMHGYVVDFLDFHFHWLSPLFYQGHFPAFNLADSAIFLGAACLIVDELLRVRKN